MIIAEIGWNFLGDLDLAKKMVKSAKENGADAVKFQLWSPKNLVPGEWDNDGRREIYNKAYINEDKFKFLYDYSKSLKIECFGSIFSEEELDIHNRISDSFVKIPSMEAHDLDLIKKCLNKFENVLVSTGALKLEELKNLENFKKEKNLIILHCVSSYPLEFDKCNFNKFFYLKEKFEKVGYSGHAKGIEDAIFAVSNGAIAIEKHFTISNNLEGRDNKFAILPQELKKLKDFSTKVSLMKLDHGLNLQKSEFEVFNSYRGRWKKK
tara:strand:+ start:188 stop:985 length:798 start_codon:yes stop_codon:yes gene_type:complete